MEDLGKPTTEEYQRIHNPRVEHDYHDYWNEYCILHMFWSTHSPEDKRQFLKENPIKRYTQKYPGEEHESSAVFSNHHKARILDEIAIDVNALAHLPSFSEEVLGRLVCEVYWIIYRKELRL